MTRRRQALGQAGEEVAAEHLEASGYRILARRYRTRLGEMDLVALGAGTVVFVEVKTRRGTGFGAPAESVNPAKQARLGRMAAQFLSDHPTLSKSFARCRFDVIAIVWPEGRAPRVEHLEDAFRPGG